MLMTFIKSIYRIALVLFIVGSIAINITMFTWQAGALALSGAYSALVGTPAVITGLANTSKNVSKRIVKRILWRSGRNIAGIWAEAIPFVGITAIVGLAALDLKDSCDTMRDMKVLNAQFDPDDITVDESTVCGMKVPTVSKVMAKVKSSSEDTEDDYNKLDDDWNLNLPSWEDAKKLFKGSDDK